MRYTLSILILSLSFFTSLTSLRAQNTPGPLPVFDAADTVALANDLKQPIDNLGLDEATKKATSDSLKRWAYAFRRLKDVIGIKKDMLFSSELSNAVVAFEDSTFVSLYMQVRVLEKGALISLVNVLGMATEGEVLDPGVSLQWNVEPVSPGQTAFKLSLQIIGSAQLNEEPLDSIAKEVNKVFIGKIFDQPEECREFLIRASTKTIEALRLLLNQRYAPRFVFDFNGKYIRSGGSFTLAFPPDDYTISIYDREQNENVSDSIQWLEPISGSINLEASMLPEGRSEILVNVKGVELNLRVLILSDDITQVLKAELSNYFEDALALALSRMQDSISRYAEEYAKEMLITENHRKSILQDFDNTYNASSSELVLSSINARPDYLEDLPDELEQNQKFKPYISSKKKAEAVKKALTILEDNKETILKLSEPLNREKFKEAVLQESSTLLAGAIIALMEGSDKQEIVNLISTQIIEIARDSTSQ
jgi:hypothetical protein